MGTGTFAEPTFLKLLEAFPGEVVGLVTQPDRDVGRRSGSSRQTGVGMGTIAKAHNIPVIQPASINSDEGIALLAALNPDLCVVAAYGQIFKAAVLAVPKLGFVNVHASLLPKYRGAAPVAHAILNGETETGVTIFRITTGIDTGEMLAKASVTIGEQETTGELEARLAPIGADLIASVIQRMKAGPITGEAQNPNAVSKAPKIMKDSGQIDWSKAAEVLVDHIRSMQPWPTAFTFLHRHGKMLMRVIISRAEVWRATDSQPSATGTISVIAATVGSLGCNKIKSEQFIVVEAGNGTNVIVQELQPAGKKLMTSSEFIRGQRLPDGHRFGPEHLS